MQFKNFLIFAILGLFVLKSESIFAQVKTTNDKGEKIIVYPDGSWEYDTSANTNTSSRPVSSVKLNAEKAAKKEAQLKAIDARREEAEMIKKERQAIVAFERFERDINLVDKNTLSEAKKAKQAQQLKFLKEQLKRAENNRKIASKNARLYEKMVDMPKAKRDKMLAKIEKTEIISNDIVTVEHTSRPSKTPKPTKQKKIKEPKVKVAATNKPAKVKKPKTPKQKKNKEPKTKVAATNKPTKVKKPKTPKPAKVKKPKVTETRPEPTRPKPVKSETFKNEEISASSYQPRLMSNPDQIAALKQRSMTLSKYRRTPASRFQNGAVKNCSFQFNEKDDFSGTYRRGLESRQLFTFTNEELIPYLDGKDYITCNGYVSEISGGRLILSLTFYIQTMDATRQFGRLEKGSPLGIKLINGKTVTLQNTKEDFGSVNRSRGQTIYYAYYSISQQQARELMESEVDKIRVVWSAGYEIYDIYELDFFKEQLVCFD